GLDSLTVAFTVENRDNSSFARMAFDLDNDGSPNVTVSPVQFAKGTLTASATYPVGTWLAGAQASDEQEHAIYATSRSTVALAGPRQWRHASARAVRQANRRAGGGRGHGTAHRRCARRLCLGVDGDSARIYRTQLTNDLLPRRRRHDQRDGPF